MYKKFISYKNAVKNNIIFFFRYRLVRYRDI